MVPIFLQKNRPRRRSLSTVWLLLGFLLLATLYCLSMVYLLTNRTLSQAAKLSWITTSLEYLLTGKTILTARVQEYYLFRSSIIPTRFNVGVGIKFILPTDSDN